MTSLIQRRNHVDEDVESEEEWRRIFEMSVAGAEPAKRILARYHGLGHASFFNAWRDVFKHVCLHGDEDEESSDGYAEEGDEDEEDAEEEEDLDLAWRQAWSGPVTAVWYSILCAVALMTMLILLPHVYQATPPCETIAGVLSPVLSTEAVERCYGSCTGASAAVAAIVEQSREAVHLVINVLLPLPSQPGTEQYWDVRLRRKVREALAPASVYRPDIGALLLVPCRELPLQPWCNLSSAWGTQRLRWHLGMCMCERV
jgi:hypothetical protein